MKKQFLTPLLLIILLAVYDFLFWNQKMAINFPIFIILLSAVLVYLFPDFKKSRVAISMLLLTITVALLVGITNTMLSKITAVIMVGIMVAFIQQVSLRSVPYAVGYTLLGFVQSPQKIFKNIGGVVKPSPNFTKIFRYHKLIYFPAIVTIIFLIVYSIGDPQFATVLDSFINSFFDWLQWLFQYFTPTHFLFLMLGALLITTSITPSSATALVEREVKQHDDLLRKRTRFIKPHIHAAYNYAAAFTRARKMMTTLKNEYRKGVLTLVMINLLLLFVNAVDVVKVWIEGRSTALLNVDQRSISNMRSSAVHEGTDALIVSILLAMAVLLYFFRGNINFLKKNELIRKLAYIWIIQNTLLLVTVAIRNYYYISDCGLTMKRIGVYAFLAATLFGLLTFFIKILEKKSSFYLVRINCWAVCTIFVVLSCVDWDPLMAQYNIQHLAEEKLDKQFLLWLSDHALPVLVQNKQIFINDNLPPEKAASKQMMFDSRVNNFISTYESHTWQSWNYADYKVYRFLKTQTQ